MCVTVGCADVCICPRCEMFCVRQLWEKFGFRDLCLNIKFKHPNTLQRQQREGERERQTLTLLHLNLTAVVVVCFASSVSSARHHRCSHPPRNFCSCQQRWQRCLNDGPTSFSHLSAGRAYDYRPHYYSIWWRTNRNHWPLNSRCPFSSTSALVFSVVGYFCDLRLLCHRQHSCELT